ncbi:hypothetical protein C8F01DRAFT_1089952 [Mycena amicta]|nr:hypothetical protein C8F01DRAFT_1089952 [Mycena amicta]
MDSLPSPSSSYVFEVLDLDLGFESLTWAPDLLARVNAPIPSGPPKIGPEVILGIRTKSEPARLDVMPEFGHLRGSDPTGHVEIRTPRALPLTIALRLSPSLSMASDNPIEILDDDDQPALQLPKSVADLIPSRALAIGRLLQLDLPPMDELNDADGYEFMSEEPTPDVETTLMFLVLPSLIFSKRLPNVSHQASLGGKQSIRIQLHPDVLFPLWIATFWIEMGEAVASQAAWTAADAWLSRTGKNTNEKNLKLTVKGLWATLPWRGNLPVFNFPVVGLARIFSKQYLHSGIVDALVAVLAWRLCRSDLEAAENTILADTSLATAFGSFHPIVDGVPTGPIATSVNGQAWLRRYSEWAKDPAHRYLFCVLHRPPNHWTTCFIDFTVGVVKYADGLHMSLPKPFFAALDVWLHQQGRGTFPVTEDLPCAKQTDGYNCPIIAINCIAHNVFGDEPWTASRADGMRMKAFCDIVKYCQTFKDSANETQRVQDPTDPVENMLAATLDFNAAALGPVHNQACGTTPASGCQSDVESSPVEPLALPVVGGEDVMDEEEDVGMPVENEPSRKRCASDEHDGERQAKVSKTLTFDDVTTAARPIRPVHSLFRPTPSKSAPKAFETKPAPFAPTPTNIGISASASKARELREQVKTGDFTPSLRRTNNFRNKILKLDAEAEFEEFSISVRHSHCGVWIKMKEPYNTYKLNAQTEIQVICQN